MRTPAAGSPIPQGGTFGMTLPFDDGTPIVDPVAPPRPRQPRRAWRRTLLIVVMAAALVGTSAALAYSIRSASAWRDDANRTAAELVSTKGKLDDVSGQLKSAQTALASTRAQLADTTTKFNTASDRIRSLADEKAQVGDQAAILAGDCGPLPARDN